jgi:hypothetical protein
LDHADGQIRQQEAYNGGVPKKQAVNGFDARRSDAAVDLRLNCSGRGIKLSSPWTLLRC